MGIRRKIAKKRTFSFAIFTAQKYNYFLNGILSSNYFSFSIFFLINQNSLTSTKNQLSNTNPPESPSKMTKEKRTFSLVKIQEFGKNLLNRK